MATVELPRHVDDPPNLLLWRLDDLAPFFLMLVIGLLINQTTLFMLLGFLAARGYGRFRESRADGFALHALYWSGLMPLGHRTTPNPYIRVYWP